MLLGWLNREGWNRPASRLYPYFDAVVGLVWSKDPKSYAGGSVPNGKVSNVGQVKSDDPDEKGYPRTPGLGLGVRPSSTRTKVYVDKPPKMHPMGLIKRIRIIEANKMHYFSTLFWYTTLHVSDRLSINHQDLLLYSQLVVFVILFMLTVC
jgi:hypothetical protein